MHGVAHDNGAVDGYNNLKKRQRPQLHEISSQVGYIQAGRGLREDATQQLSVHTRSAS